LDFKKLDLKHLVERVLAGEELQRAEASAVLNCSDENLPELLAATLKVREVTFGRRVKICVLRNAQSGICAEDCHYCSQSRISRADIPVYKLQSVAELIEGARLAVSSGARRYCMVCSMRGPGPREIDHLAQACESIRGEFPGLELCLSLGLLDEEQARKLKEAGAGWINHNLNTSRRFYPEICTTHTWDDRVRTIENVRSAGL
jgi:biotin synthase